jgi:hypothetical protein
VKPRFARKRSVRTVLGRVALVPLFLSVLVLLHGPRAGAIVDGAPTGAGRARNVGTLVVSGDGLPWFWAGCGVTLISPRVGVTAGHCIAFGFRRSAFTRIGVSFATDHVFRAPLPADLEVHEGTDALHPNFKPVFGGGLPLQDHNDPALADVAVIVFNEPIKGMRPARLPRVGIFETASEGQDLWPRWSNGPFDVGVVGYGTTSLAAATGAAPFDGGTRRFTTMQLDAVYPAVATLSPSPGDTCFFDSGGPAFPTAAGHVPPVMVTVHGIIVGPARADTLCSGGTTVMRLDAPHISRWLRDMIAAFGEGRDAQDPRDGEEPEDD